MVISVQGRFVSGLWILLLQLVIAEGFNCTFDTDTCGWTQGQGDILDWTRHANGTTTRGTGPDFDHTSGHGYYMYIETSGLLLEGNTARLISPVINGANQMCLTFYYHMYGIHIGALNVYFSRNGSLGSPVWTKDQPQNNAWKSATVQISGGSTTSAVTNIVFEGVRGAAHEGDIAIDDVSLQEGTCPEVTSGTLRLISPLDNGIGRLEVYYNGSWGTVCDNGFTDQAAKVACRQLGIMKTWSMPTTANIDPGSGRIWLDDIRCSGNEASLAECGHSPWGSHSCSHSGDVGVDCDIQGLNCTFETNTCGWTQDRRDSFNWKWSTSGNGTGPNSDHTSGRGSYVYIDTSHPAATPEVAHLISPTINGSARTCFTFYYYMLSPNVSTLNVYLYAITLAGSPIWTKDTPQGNTWKKGMVQIAGGSATSSIRHIVFEGVRGAAFHGSVAIDDVTVTPGTCPQGFSCTFDTDTCGWTQGQRDSFDWTRQANDTATRGTGPDFDHTSGRGYYMYIEASGFLLEGNTARLISPVINGANQMCLTFYYHMYGIHIGALNVYFSRNGLLGTPVWTKDQPQNNAWKSATVQISGGSTTSAVTNIVFEGVRGAAHQGDIAIDDVSLQEGTCPEVPSGTVRLISPLDNGIGRLEVYHNGSWGTVCDNGFTDQAAEVVCRQLGIIKTWSKPTKANVDPGSGRIWLDDIRCIGNESSFADCGRNPWGSHSCSHSQDVGVDCDIQGLNCTFESNTCGWTQGGRDSLNWKWSTSGNGTGPNSDHTSGRGSYVYIDTSYPAATEEVAHLISPTINGSARTCFTFYYYMLSPNVSTLNVYLYAIRLADSPIWTKDTSQGNTWKKGMVQIAGGSATAQIRHIVFEGVRGAAFHGSVAIDDVIVTPGTCPQGFSCTFDTDTCGWTQGQRDSFDWTRQANGTTTRGTGPDFDHTSGLGYYMYIEASGILLEGNTARLVSPVINGANQMCLTFYYHMYGIHIGALNVYFSRNGSLGSPVWTKDQPQNNAWERATVQISGGSTTSAVTNIVFEGVRGAAHQGDIAIDDVSLQEGTCPEVPSGAVRLISPMDNGIGRLEVYHNGSWGTVCDNGFTDQAAEVACRQLGILKTWSKPTTANVDPGNGRIWLDDVRCTGNETSLAECGHNPWGSHSCSHSQDVGVNCDIRGLNCTFETNTCGWTQGRRDRFNWKWSPSANGTGPNSDHTSGRGSYVYIDSSHAAATEGAAHLISPTINGSARACFTFYYHMFGLNVSTLNVYLYAIRLAGSPIWTKSKSQGNTWKKGMVQIAGGSATASIRHIGFEGVRGVGYHGSIAVDDVTVTPGTCPQEGFNCNFDTSACDWIQEKGDNFDWTRHTGPTNTTGTGPSVDHTSGHGYYMYIEASGPRTPGHKARLTSPVINGTNQMCLVFYYHIYGLHIGSLNVYFSRSGSLGSPVWAKLQSQGNVWNRGTVQIDGGSTTSTVTNIVFEGVRGVDYQGDIAIDDVSLQTGSCPQVPSGTARLISTLNNGVGRLEVFHNGSWGTVCDNGITDQAATVACRQLGLLKTWSAPTTVKGAGGSGRIWLDNVRCMGNESSLAECNHSPWGSHSCSHSQDVGLNCDTEGMDCTFESNTCGWTQGRRDNFNWARSSPGAAYISGHRSYMYIETSYPHAEKEVAHFISPTINGSERICLTFYYHMFGPNVSTLNVFLYGIGSGDSPIWTKAKSQGNAWKKGMVQIAGGSATARIRHIIFEGVRGSGYKGSIAIDDVTITPGTCQQVKVPEEQHGGDDVTSGVNTVAIVIGVVAVVIIVVLVAVIIYLYRKRHSHSGVTGFSMQRL